MSAVQQGCKRPYHSSEEEPQTKRIRCSEEQEEKDHSVRIIRNPRLFNAHFYTSRLADITRLYDISQLPAATVWFDLHKVWQAAVKEKSTRAERILATRTHFKVLLSTLPTAADDENTLVFSSAPELPNLEVVQLQWEPKCNEKLQQFIKHYAPKEVHLQFMSNEFETNGLLTLILNFDKKTAILKSANDSMCDTLNIQCFLAEYVSQHTLRCWERHDEDEAIILCYLPDWFDGLLEEKKISEHRVLSELRTI